MTISGDPIQNSQVVIIGAGPSGLAVGGCLRHEGIPFVMLDRAPDVGSSWRQHYDRLHLHTTKQFSALPYRPFPPGTPLYPSRQQMVDYLTSYAAHFQIEPRFNQNVKSVRRVEAGWEIKTANTTYQSQQVVLATGTNCVPYVPTWPGQTQYSGQLLHTANYKNGERFRGQRVLVVGFGNSGTEIAIDLWEHGAQPILAVRGSVNVVRRDMLGVIPVQMISILLKSLPASLVDRINAPFARLQFGKLSDYHLQKLPYGAATQISVHGQIPMIDIGVMKLIRERHIHIRPGIAEFTADGVIFIDGRQEVFDAVLLATGYRSGLEAILPSEYALLNEKGFPLISGRSVVPGLYFAGFYVSGAGMLYEINREARGIVRAIIEHTTKTH
jgi:indole-3-pyruvate monooxygenase